MSVQRACAAANEKELTTCAKSGGQEEKTFKKKWEQPDRSRRQPAAGRRPLVAGIPTTSSRGLVARPPVAGIPATRGRRPKVGGPGPAGDQQSPAGRGLTPGPVGLSQFF
jgi:hypothetical protein